jgi:hypothetical protein
MYTTVRAVPYDVCTLHIYVHNTTMIYSGYSTRYVHGHHIQYDIRHRVYTVLIGILYLLLYHRVFIHIYMYISSFNKSTVSTVCTKHSETSPFVLADPSMPPERTTFITSLHRHWYRATYSSRPLPHPPTIGYPIPRPQSDPRLCSPPPHRPCSPPLPFCPASHRLYVAAISVGTLPTGFTVAMVLYIRPRSASITY